MRYRYEDHTSASAIHHTLRATRSADQSTSSPAQGNLHLRFFPGQACLVDVTTSSITSTATTNSSITNILVDKHSLLDDKLLVDAVHGNIILDIELILDGEHSPNNSSKTFPSLSFSLEFPLRFFLDFSLDFSHDFSLDFSHDFSLDGLNKISSNSDASRCRRRFPATQSIL